MAGSINDVIRNSLIAKGYFGEFNDMLFKYFGDNGATGSTLNDREFSWLASKGQGIGPLNQRWYNYLRNLGYTGALNDMLYAAAVAGTLFPSGFDPLTLPGLTGWYDASDAASVTITSNVSQWNDKSGGGNHATQGVAGSRYVYTPASVNGLAAMVNSGVDSFMNIGAKVLPANSHYAFMVMCNTINTIGLGTGSGGNDYMLRLSAVSGGSLIEGFGGGNTLLSGLGSGTTNNTPHVIAHVCDAVNVTLHYDATTNTNAQTGAYTLNMLTGDSLGGYGLTGKVCEIIFGTSLLTGTQITNVKTYLKNKWGTP